jgi:hypothetical protein
MAFHTVLGPHDTRREERPSQGLAGPSFWEPSTGGRGKRPKAQFICLRRQPSAFVLNAGTAKFPAQTAFRIPIQATGESSTAGSHPCPGQGAYGNV